MGLSTVFIICSFCALWTSEGQLKTALENKCNFNIGSFKSEEQTCVQFLPKVISVIFFLKMLMVTKAIIIRDLGATILLKTDSLVWTLDGFKSLNILGCL